MAKLSLIILLIVAAFVIAQIRLSHSEQPEEVHAYRALRAVAVAQRAYAALNGGYAGSLKTLAVPCTEKEDGFISPDLSTDPTIKHGYEIRIHADAENLTGRSDCHGNPTTRAYYATAVPIQRDITGQRAFGVDQNDVIWYDTTGAAPKPPFSETAGLQRLHGGR